ncbi:hypothetical protein T492DRAFT_1066210 [Pavlovales sp. CCMP2436]|nr:hypothetical protein T492DRAFT_1066210 [Pavlovales sp. CCMP2436]|mmetsp:Transcript_50573/g.118818  ORF Transcript_50573/g.118818 Transcript_50573/m.118818 type:complete len:248 (+) Transcript_50573:156-899(+)
MQQDVTSVPVTVGTLGTWLDDTDVSITISHLDTVGEIKRRLSEQHGLRTDKHTLLLNFEHLEDERKFGQYKLRANAQLTIMPNVGGLPPQSCCCFGIYDGAIFFTWLFIWLQMLGMLATFFGALFGALSACRWFDRESCPSVPVDSSDLLEIASYTRFLSGLVIASLLFVWNAIELAIGIWGLYKIRARDVTGLKIFMFAQCFLLALTGVFALGVTLPFYAWYIYCLKVLHDELRREEELPLSRNPN